MAYLKAYIKPDYYEVYAAVVVKMTKEENGNQRFLKAFRFKNIKESIKKLKKWFKFYYLRNKHHPITAFKIIIYDPMVNEFIDESIYEDKKGKSKIHISIEKRSDLNYWFRNAKSLLHKSCFNKKKKGGQKNGDRKSVKL